MAQSVAQRHRYCYGFYPLVIWGSGEKGGVPPVVDTGGISPEEFPGFFVLVQIQPSPPKAALYAAVTSVNKRFLKIFLVGSTPTHPQKGYKLPRLLSALHDSVAQLVAHLIFNQDAVGSSPARVTNKNRIAYNGYFGL